MGYLKIPLGAAGNQLVEVFESQEYRNLIAEFGAEGCAVYWTCQHEFYRHRQGRIAYTSTITRIVASQLFISKELTIAIFKEMLKQGLMKEEDDYLTMPVVSLLLHKAKVLQLKRQRAATRKKTPNNEA